MSDDVSPKPTAAAASRTRFGRALAAVAVVALVGAVGWLGAGPAFAAGSQTGLITISPASQSHDSGTPQSYSIAISCQGSAAPQCGPNAQVHVPLDSTTTPSMTDPSWTFAVTSSTSGLVTGWSIVSGELVVDLDPDIFVSGFSGTLAVRITPPNGSTPNDTSWTLTPQLTGDGLTQAVTAPGSAASTATASPKPVVTKSITSGGSVFEAGTDVDYTITASCSIGSSGGLYLENGVLVDQLPAGMSYVSSTPAGSYDATTGTVTWTFPDGASTPAGCAADAAGPTQFHVVATTPTPAPAAADQPLSNQATFTGTGADATDPDGITKDTTATAAIQVVDEPPTTGGTGYASITKSSLAPLAEQGVSGNQYVATYPGNWLPAGTSPGYQAGQAAASYQTVVRYGLVGTYTTRLVDPVPCLDEVNGDVYSSDDPSAVCAHPAFHTTVFQVSSPGRSGTTGLGQAVANGWAPQLLLDDGSTVTATPTSTVAATASSAYYAVDAADVGHVAAVILPPSPGDELENASLALTLWGYADASLANVGSGITELHNVATAYPTLAGVEQTPISDSADLFTVGSPAQLGVSKSFGALGAAAGGTTALTINGAVATPGVLSHDVVITDLLPTGMTWSNPVTSLSATLAPGGGTSSTAATASVQYLEGYLGSQQNLIRITIPAASFSGAGNWTITFPAGSFLLSTPTALGVYTNTDQIFLSGLGAQAINPMCSTPKQASGVSSASFETENSLDLAGDGEHSEQHCQNQAALQIFGTGASFALTKTVQGDLDALPLGGPSGIGTASEGGTGSYVLTWTNTGSDTLAAPVVYDILPYVGDTGVSAGQASTGRGSEFSPDFTGVGALPSGVSVEYSSSTNPCRDEVYADAANADCVDDWTSTAPADLATVAALRFTSTDSYVAGTGFAVSIAVKLNAADVNKVAWNSAATNAEDLTQPSVVPLPAEPPKVGITSAAAPTIASSTSAPSVAAGSAINDTIRIAGTGGHAATLAWSLVGPVAAVKGACAAVDWTGAATVASGTEAIAGDGTVTLDDVVVETAGCYGWVNVLTADTAGDFPTATAPAGSPNEVTLVMSDPDPVLASTGVDPTPLVLTALGLLAGGLALLLLHGVRRRPRVTKAR